MMKNTSVLRKIAFCSLFAIGFLTGASAYSSEDSKRLAMAEVVENGKLNQLDSDRAKEYFLAIQALNPDQGKPLLRISPRFVSLQRVTDSYLQLSCDYGFDISQTSSFTGVETRFRCFRGILQLCEFTVPFSYLADGFSYRPDFSSCEGVNPLGTVGVGTLRIGEEGSLGLQQGQLVNDQGIAYPDYLPIEYSYVSRLGQVE